MDYFGGRGLTGENGDYPLALPDHPRLDTQRLFPDVFLHRPCPESQTRGHLDSRAPHAGSISGSEIDTSCSRKGFRYEVDPSCFPARFQCQTRTTTNPPWACHMLTKGHGVCLCAESPAVCAGRIGNRNIKQAPPFSDVLQHGNRITANSLGIGGRVSSFLLSRLL